MWTYVDDENDIPVNICDIRRNPKAVVGWGDRKFFHQKSVENSDSDNKSQWSTIKVPNFKKKKKSYFHCCCLLRSLKIDTAKYRHVASFEQVGKPVGAYVGL